MYPRTRILLDAYDFCHTLTPILYAHNLSGIQTVESTGSSANSPCLCVCFCLYISFLVSVSFVSVTASLQLFTCLCLFLSPSLSLSFSISFLVSVCLCLSLVPSTGKAIKGNEKQESSKTVHEKSALTLETGYLL